MPKKNQQIYADEIIQKWKNFLEDNLIKTSGSTGIPKIIILERKYMDKSAKASIKALALSPEDVFLISLSLQTVGGLMLLYRAFLLDAKFKVIEPKANPLLELEMNHEFTVISLVPYQLATILEDESSIKKLNRFRLVLLGGSSIPENLLPKIKSLKPVIYHSYGMTETYSHIALKKLNGNVENPHFKPIENIVVFLDDFGKLCIKGFKDNETIYTNDIAKIFEDNSFEILGRADDVIVSGGIKIQLQEIEKTIQENKSLQKTNFFVWYKTDEKLGQKLIVILENKTLTKEQILEIKTDLKKQIESNKIPKEYISVDKFYYTESQKIDKLKTAKFL